MPIRVSKCFRIDDNIIHYKIICILYIRKTSHRLNVFISIYAKLLYYLRFLKIISIIKICIYYIFNISWLTKLKIRIMILGC